MSVVPRLRHWGGIALELLFPRSCVGCGREGDLICERCRTTLKPISGPVCPKCGRPEINGIICPDCMFRDTRIDGVRSVFQFQGVMRQAVHDFKYHNIRILAPVLAAFMADYLQEYPVPAEILIPVPLHPKRLRERGYNQAELIARELSLQSGIPMDTGLLFRRKYTTAQARTKSLEQRRANMIDAFTCRKPAADLTIMLLDDVTTSATTLEACAAVLKAAGASSVWGFTLAREI